MFHRTSHFIFFQYVGLHLEYSAMVQRLNQKEIHPRIIDSPELAHDSRVKITLVARPLLMPDAQMLCRCERGVFTSRTCVHSRELI
jgi:hypothetical protein